MSEQEEVVMVLGRWEAVKDVMVIGTKKVVADCGHACAIAPSGQAMLAATPGATTKCLECMGGKQAMTDPSTRHRRFSVPGSERELEQLLGKEEATFVRKLVTDQ